MKYSRKDGVNIFIEHLYMLLDEGIIDEYDYGRLIGAICVTRGLYYSDVTIKKYEE